MGPFGRDLAPRLRLALVIAAVTAGALVRLLGVDTALLFGDEFHSLRHIARGYVHLLTTYPPHGSGLALPLIQRVAADLFGLSHWTIRLPAILGGIATLALVYPLGRSLVGRTSAAIATCLVATSSILIFYSHFGRAYSLATCLSFVTVFVLHRVVAGGRVDGRCGAATAVLAALLPYVHLAALGSLVPLGMGALAALAVQRRRRDFVRLASAIAAGLLGAFLLHLPALSSLSVFLRKRTTWEYSPAFGPSDVLCVLAGSRAGGLLIGSVVAVAVVALSLRQRERSWPLVMGCVGPVLALVMARPYGDPYAYARYASTGLPLAFLATGWLLFELCRRTRRAGLRHPGALAAGLALALALHVAGPLGPGQPRNGPHANTYLGLFPLPRFDVPWEGSPFYDELARDPGARRIIESPALTNRARHLYRNYYLRHGKETWLGLFPQELPLVPAGPYVSLADPDLAERSGADYLILHVDPVAEVQSYWRFVYGEPRADGPGTAALMARHDRYDDGIVRPSPHLRSRLRRLLGPPLYADGRIEVWSLRGDRPQAP